LKIDDSEASQTKYLKEILVPAGGGVAIEWSYELGKLVSGNEPFITSLPADGMVITVAHPATYVVGVTAFHASQITLTPDTAPGTKSWSLNAPLLPQQGVCVYWSKNDGAQKAT
jgi:hypothetical protein